jgi:hypothetical protein
MIKKWAMFILALSLFSGCMSRHFVDPKGRDCITYGIFFPPIYWDKCDTIQEPLAQHRLRADVNLNKGE